MILIPLVALCLAQSRPAPAQIVVAIRYLQPKGVSHSHLYLFREDGKLLRQLTRDNFGQDREPRFSPDGEIIVFQREIPKRPLEYWSIGRRGRGLHTLPKAPEWYSEKGRAAYFTMGERPSGETVHTPDGRYELLLKEDGEEAQTDLIGESGKHYAIRDTRSGKDLLLSGLPGFEGAKNLLQESGTGKPFLWTGGLHVAFFELHLNSTDGTTVYAFDFNHLRFVRLSPNWATPIPLPGEPTFLTRAENLYVPIRGTRKTANCSYVERWNNDLRRTRYAKNEAAICYGASMYRPGHTPRVIDVR